MRLGDYYRPGDTVDAPERRCGDLNPAYLPISVFPLRYRTCILAPHHEGDHEGQPYCHDDDACQPSLHRCRICWFGPQCGPFYGVQRLNMDEERRCPCACHTAQADRWPGLRTPKQRAWDVLREARE